MPIDERAAHTGSRNRILDPRVLACALAWMAVILAVHRESPFTLVSAHGLLHAAIAERLLLAPAVLPPENPFFAGEPLAYYWSFHLLVASVSRLFGIDVLHALELWILVAAAGLVLLAAGLGRGLYGRIGPGLLISFLVLAGAQPQAPLVLLFRSLRHGGLPADDGSYLWGLVHPASAWMRLGDPFGQLGPLVNYYLNTTSRPLALTTLVGVVWALAVTLRSPHRGAPWLAGATALLALWSPILAIAGGLSLAGAVLAVEVSRSRGWLQLGGASALPGVPAAGALVAGILVALPTYAHLLGGAAGEGNGLLGQGLGTAVAHTGWALASGWALAALACLGILRAPLERRLPLLVCGVAALPLLVATATVILPAGNFVNFFHAALVLLAVPAAGAARGSDGEPSRGRALAIVALFLPSLLLVLWTYTGRPPTEVVIQDGQLAQRSGPRATIYRWLRVSSPLDAVVVIDPGPPTRASQGNTAELPALTGRTLFTERAHHYIVSPYPRAGQRVAIAQALARGEALSAEGQQLLAALARPVYVLVRGEARAAARARWGEPVVATEPLALHRWQPR